MRCKDLDTKKFEYFCSRAAAGIGILILGFLSLYCLFYTEEFVANRTEELQLVKDSPVFILVCVICAGVFLRWTARQILQNEINRKRNLRIFLVFTCTYVAVLGFAWAVLCKYTMATFWDSQMISRFADIFANHVDRFSQRDLDYISAYPHQLGLIALVEQIYRISGFENYRAFQALNAVAAAGIVFVGYRFVKEISDREEAGVYFLLLMLCCWPLIIYVTFFYGEILSILFSLVSLYMLMLYLKKKRKRDVLYMALAITAACLIRSNCYIVLAAMGCVLVVKSVSEKTLRHIWALLSCILLFFLVHTAVVKVYEQKLDMNLDKGMPALLWIAMGTQEGENGKEAGWYNSLSWEIFVDETGKDRKEASSLAKEVLSEKAKKYREDPSYMLDFYKRKIVSQWCEPTYASQVETNHRDSERGPLMESIYKGSLWKPFVQLMNAYQSLIYCGMFVFLVCFVSRRIPVEHLGLLITFIGGFLFYSFWEAKSRYVFPYFVMGIPMAAVGLDTVTQKVAVWVKNYSDKSREKRIANGKEPWRVPVEYLEPWAGKLILLGAGVPSLLLFFYSLFYTTVYENNDFEIPSRNSDPVLLILLCIVVGFLALCMIENMLLRDSKKRKKNLNLLLGAVLLHCAVFCTAWNLLAQSALRADPLYIHTIAGGFATGDVSAGGMDYLYTYPHQAGQALLLELVYRIFGYENLLAFRMLNTLGGLVFVYSGY